MHVLIMHNFINATNILLLSRLCSNNNFLISCSTDTSYQLQVDYQGVYLLRLINAVANETMVFDIAYHSFTIVGQNGAYATRSFTNSLTLAPGQTRDILLSANQNLGQYYMTARPLSGRHNTTGIIQYSASTGL